MSTTSKGKGKETLNDHEVHVDPGSSGEEEVEEILQEASTPSTSSKKKKKKRNKAMKALNALRGQKDSVPQELVNVVLDKVKEQEGPAAGADEATVRKALEQMNLKDLLQGKAAMGGTNKKDLGEHKVRRSIHEFYVETAYVTCAVLGYTTSPTTW